MAAVKAILAAPGGLTIENAVTVWTRHATPIALAHLRISGPTGRQVYRALGGGPPDTWIPGLHSLDDMPALARAEDGQLLHTYAGSPRNPPVEGEELTPEERRELLDSRGVWDAWLRGRGYAHVNGRDAERVPFVGLLASAELVDLLSAAVVWRDDEQTWAQCPARYKTEAGGPRVDLDEATQWTEIRPPGPPE